MIQLILKFQSFLHYRKHSAPSPAYLRYLYRKGQLKKREEFARSYHPSVLFEPILTPRIDHVVGEYIRGKSMEVIAEPLKVTRERIRQILMKAERQLKQKIS